MSGEQWVTWRNERRKAVIFVTGVLLSMLGAIVAARLIYMRLHPESMYKTPDTPELKYFYTPPFNNNHNPGKVSEII